jgi:hypothetical protein
MLVYIRRYLLLVVLDAVRPAHALLSPRSSTLCTFVFVPLSISLAHYMLMVDLKFV